MEVISCSCYDNNFGFIKSEESSLNYQRLEKNDNTKSISQEGSCFKISNLSGTYGTTVNAFRHYFQLGESKVTNSLFHHKYFKSMTSGDAKRVEAYHTIVHGV